MESQRCRDKRGNAMIIYAQHQNQVVFLLPNLSDQRG